MSYIGNQSQTAYSSLVKQDITGNGGLTYTLSHPVSNEDDILLYINNVKQEGGSGKAFTASGTTLTLSEAIANTDSCYVQYIGLAIQTTVPPDGSVSTAKIASSAVDLTSKVTGVLPVANGGTGATSYVETNSVIETFYYHTTDIAEGNNAVLDQTWYRKTNHGTANKNGGMSASSGIWTFPSTGIWQTTLVLNFYTGTSASNARGIKLYYTSDNGTNNNEVFRMYNGFHSSGANENITMPYTFNITDTSNQKFYHQIYGDYLTVRGGNDNVTTLLHFIKLCPSV